MKRDEMLEWEKDTFGNCHHRDWRLAVCREGDAGEWHLYAECNECGQKKSSLVDFPRNYANCGPVGESEWETNVDGLERE